MLLVAVIALALAAAQLATLTSNHDSKVSDSEPLPDASPAQGSLWSVQEVLTGGAFGTICMALDSEDNPRIVHAGKNGMMYYTFWDGSDWRTQSIIQGGNPNALLLDSGNRPHMLFKGANGVTYYATLKASGWVYHVVPEGNRYAMVLDSKGNPHLAYGTQLSVYHYPPGPTNNYHVLNYASWNGTGWSQQVVQQQISSSSTISLALDSNNRPNIMYSVDMYYPRSGGYTLTVKIATLTGSSWSIQTGPSDLDSLGKIVLDSQGNPHFSYARHYPHESGGNVSLGYASWNGASWRVQTVAAHLYLPGLDLRSELVLDSHDNAHIEFFNGSLMYASQTDTNWNLETVAPDKFAYNAGPLCLDTQDRPNICYWVNDITNTTAFVSMLIITTPTPQYRQGPLPRPTSPAPPAPLASASKLWVQPSNWSRVSFPVLADGLVYVSSGNSGTGTLGVLCLNASSGAQIWSHRSLLLTYTLANGHVYIGEANYDPDYSLQGVVSCLNAATGTQVWNFSVGTSFTTPKVSEGIAYVGGHDYTPSTDVNVGFIYALNASTGEKLWAFQGPSGTRFDNQSPILEDANLYAISAVYSSHDASWHAGIYAFNAKTGELLWNYTKPGQLNSILAKDQAIYASFNAADTRDNLDAADSGGYVYEGGVLALNASNGALLWNYEIDSSVKASIAVDGRVYAVSDNGVLYALGTSDGRAIWSYTAGTGLDSVQSVDGYLYVGSSTGVLCINAFDGTVVWNFAASDFAGTSPSHPAYFDGIVYVGANGPMFFSPVTQYNFYALSASTGEKLWNYTLEYGISSPPTIKDGIVYISGNFLTRESPDYENTGAILALKPTIASLPLQISSPKPSPTIPEFPTWITIFFLALLILPLIIIKKFNTT